MGGPPCRDPARGQAIAPTMRAMNMVGPLVCPILVGRDDLLALAERRLEQAAGGRGHVLFLAGEAGIGKTRLLGSIERRAAALGFRVARGGTYPGDLEVPGAVFLELARVMRRTPALAATGEQVASRLASADSVTDGTPDGDAHRRRRLLTLDVADDLAAVAADGPTLLCLEDLHQADDLTLEIVANLARRAVDLPLLVLATYRSDELYPRVPMREWRARLLAQRQAEEARLRRLDLDETATMASVLLAAGEPAPRDIAVAIHDRTDGIPLHVEELIGLLGASGTANLAATAQDVPDTLEAAILGRFGLRSPRRSRLPGSGRSSGARSSTTCWPGSSACRRTRATRSMRRSRSWPTTSCSPRRRPRGATGSGTRSSATRSMPASPTPSDAGCMPGSRTIASARGDFSDAFLSLQLERAGKRAEAFERRAGQGPRHRDLRPSRGVRAVRPRAAQRAPGPAAGRAGRAARGARPRGIRDRRQPDRRRRVRGGPRRLAAGGPAARAAEAVVPLVGALHLLGADLAQRTAAWTRRSPRSGRPRRQMARGRRRDGRPPGPPADRGGARRRLHAQPAARRGRRPCGGRPGARQGGVGRRHAPEREVTLAACLAFRGDVEASVALLERQIAAARTAGAEAEASRGYRMLGSVASVIVEYERGERWLRDGIDLAERVERWNDRHYLAAHLAHVLWATGRWDDAAAVAEHAKHDGRGGITTRITADHVLGYVALGRGELDRARRRRSRRPVWPVRGWASCSACRRPCGASRRSPCSVATRRPRSAGSRPAASRRSRCATRPTCSRSR